MLLGNESGDCNGIGDCVFYLWCSFWLFKFYYFEKLFMYYLEIYILYVDKF